MRANLLAFRKDWPSIGQNCTLGSRTEIRNWECILCTQSKLRQAFSEAFDWAEYLALEVGKFGIEMRMATIATIACILTGCADYDLREMSTLEPLGNGTFKWKTMADAVYPIDNPRAEAQRMAQLDKMMKLNQQCVRGYAVLDRSATRKIHGALGDIYDVFYSVKCR